MALDVKPSIVKIWKNYIRISYPILHIIPIYKKCIALTIK